VKDFDEVWVAAELVDLAQYHVVNRLGDLLVGSATIWTPVVACPKPISCPSCMAAQPNVVGVQSGFVTVGT